MMNFQPKHLYYLASPYSHKDKEIQEERFKTITKVAAHLKQRHNLTLITPITASHEIAKHMDNTDTSGGFSSWADDDLTFIHNCKGIIIVLMDGFDLSVGVAAEFEYAQKLLKDIFFYNHDQDQFYKYNY